MLRQSVEKRFGHPIESRSDFSLLAIEIERITHEHIAENTCAVFGVRFPAMTQSLPAHWMFYAAMWVVSIGMPSAFPFRNSRPESRTSFPMAHP